MALAEELSDHDPVLRYRTDAVLSGEEGTFLICSFSGSDQGRRTDHPP
jgi:hypothetical protein